MRPLRYVQVFLVLAILGGGLFLFSKSGFLPQEVKLPCTGCNVILISIDTLGANHLSLYDDTLDTTPFLKSLSNSAAVFDAAYVQAPWTLPSHVAMLTGKYPWDLNMWIPSDILSKDALTIAEQLQSYGYQTVAYSNGAFVRPGWSLDQGFDEFYGSVAEADWEDVPKIFNDSYAWVSRRTEVKPYFLFIHTFEVHDPYTEDPSSVVDIKDIATSNLSSGGVSAERTTQFKEEYYKEIRKTDTALKQFFDDLKKSGTLKNTIIIVTSDHGEEFGEHGTVAFHAVTAYREVLRVPLIIAVPGLKGLRVQESVEIRSIPATILELAGLPTNLTVAPSLAARLEGINLGDAVVLSATALDRATLLQNFSNGYGASALVPKMRTTPYEGPRTFSAIKSSQHAIEFPDTTEHVFDMDTDPGETKTLPPNEHVEILRILNDFVHER